MPPASPTPGEQAELDALIALALRDHRAGRLAEAAAAYGKILALRPDIADAHNNLGNVLLSQGRPDEAVPRFERALSLRPDFAEAHYNLGLVWQRQGKFDQAQVRFERVLALRPDFAEAHFNLGLVLQRQGKLDQARPRHERVLALRPDFADAHFNLGLILQRQGHLDQACPRYEQALALRPDYPDAHNNLGIILAQQGKFDLAIARFERVVALRPDHAEARYNLGNALKSQGKFDQAATRYRQAIALKPDHAEAHTNLGNVLRDQGHLDEAKACYRQAIALRPDIAGVHFNLGNVLKVQGRLDEASAEYQRAIALQPDYGEPKMFLAGCQLVQGDFERGWKTYEGRLSIHRFLPVPSFPRWTGQPLAGRSLLLMAEPGLGHTLQFVRYARAFKQRGARVVLAAQAALVRLLAGHPDLDELFALDYKGTLPQCDFYLPLLSSPFALGTTPATIPREVPYLSANPALIDAWQQELAAIDGFRIGILWQGSREYHFDRWRSFPLANLTPLARLPGVRLISLQKGAGSEQLATVDFPVLDFSDRLDTEAGPFMDTAAVMRNLDLVVTADSAVAHLAGALGVPVWLALQFSPYWPWLLAGDDTAWYPTMRLFRQTAFDRWSDVFERMAQALAARRSETKSFQRGQNPLPSARPTPSEPAELDALVALALSEHRAGRLAEAAAVYGKILSLHPNIAQAHNNLGNVLLSQGKPDEAVPRFERAIALRPDFDEAHFNLGFVLQQQGKFDQARAHYEQALTLQPDHAEAHYNLGIIFAEQGKFDLAVERFERMVALRPDHAEARYNLAGALKSQGRLDQAAACYEQAIALKSDYAEAHNNLGNVLRDQGRLDEATARYEQALALKPDLAEAHFNLGKTLLVQRKLGEAATRFRRALALIPGYADAAMELAACYLVEGDYELGFRTYEGRLGARRFLPAPSFPRWTGQPLAGCSLLLVAEQGLGDTIQFIRYARALKERGARVVLAAPAALGRLLAAHPDLDELFILGSAAELPRCDFYLPLLSAPFALGTTASSIPRDVPYLSADPDLIDAWRGELAGMDGYRIGISWQGARSYDLDRLRSIPLAHFAPLAAIPGVRLISLQKGFGSEQLATVDFPVLDLSCRLDTASGAFMDTAAVMRNLDLVVTSDTSIAHLAGALGVPVWVALQFSPFWSWLLDREDSPWYPTMRLFRQTTFGGWPDVFERIAHAVETRRSETK